MTVLIATTLSFALPAAVFIHAIWRLFRAGALKRAVFAIGPAMNFAFASLWLARSCSAAMQGGLSAAAQSAQLTAGPVLALVLVGVTELPFLALYLHDLAAARRSKTRR